MLAGGRPLEDERELARIRKLAIPPAWSDVWICPSRDGHLQATGRDARGRKQYRYHAQWRCVRDEAKFERLAAFAEALPRLRARVAEHLALPGLPREKVLAAIISLLEATLIRIGNDEYARTNNSYGLTTLRGKHVALNGHELSFDFVGKGGKRHRVSLRDARLARIVRRSRELPGQTLFQYVDDAGEARSVGSGDVNAYLREATGAEFTAKDFRTWGATVLAATEFASLGAPQTATEAKRNVVAVATVVAERLGNTPAVCRQCYIHPRIIEAYAQGATIGRPRARIGGTNGHGLSAEERAVLRLLRSGALAAAS